MMKTIFIKYTEYNVWANTKLAEYLKSLDIQVLDKEVKSSFPTLRKTIHHIWDAELTWLARIKGQALSWPPTASYENPTIDAFVETSKVFMRLIENSSEEFLKSQSTYTNSAGKLFSSNNGDIVFHCMNHSTFHRGQVITILRGLGHQNLFSTDMVTFFREIDS